jgi:tyrosyl-tRNA synthetase
MRSDIAACHAYYPRMKRASDLLAELEWRGLLYQQSEGLAAELARGSVSAYCGFDPTSSSLHVGSLVPVMGLMHLQRHGHRPIALVGGGTGMIGDPSGKTAERQLLTREQIEENAEGIRSQLARFLDFSGSHAARMGNNAEWLLPMRAVDFMRDVGKHFTVNYMLAKDSVRSRTDAGISYTEFSYMLLQAVDYLELFRREGATLQVGGSDQWGNITAGIELIRRTEGASAFALTFPLVATAAGTKFGKTEAGAVWLDSARTSPYAFYQFWINVDDRDAPTYLRYFSLFSREEIAAMEEDLAAHPERRTALSSLAADVTARVHGESAARTAAEVSSLLFGKADPRSLSAAAFEAMHTEMPFFRIDGAAGGAGGSGSALDTQQVLDAITGEGRVIKSKAEGRRLLQQGGLYLNGERMTAERRVLGDGDLLPGGHLLLRKGAREYALIQVVR